MNVFDRLRFGKKGIDENYWHALFHEMNHNNVIPVIGPNAIRYSQSENLNQYVLRRICEELHVDPCASYDELLYSGIDEIDLHICYSQIINNLTEAEKADIKEQSKELVEFLKTKTFPLILSFLPDNTLEVFLKDIWKNRIPKEGYKVSLNMNDIIYGPFDDKIVSNDYLDTPKGWTKKYPFLVYLFGKSTEMGKCKPFAITEDDMMFYIRHLILPTIMPSRLSDNMKNKFFLFIGCDFTEWMFRFLYGAWRNIYGGKTDSNKIGTLLDTTLTIDTNDIINNKAFDYFVKEVNLKISENHLKYLDTLTKGYHLFLQENKDKYQLPPHIDVFVSYASEDFEYAKALCELLTSNGIEVWFDKKEDIENPNRLQPGDHFPTIINEAIGSCTLFVPLITNMLMKNATADRYVFKEWEQANKLYPTKIAQNPRAGFILSCFLDVSFDVFIKSETVNPTMKVLQSYIKQSHHRNTFTEERNPDFYYESLDKYNNLSNESKIRLINSATEITNRIKKHG